MDHGYGMGDNELIIHMYIEREQDYCSVFRYLHCIYCANSSTASYSSMRTVFRFCRTVSRISILPQPGRNVTM